MTSSANQADVPADVRTVAVRLCLAGGHQFSVNLPSDSPLLLSLFTALAANSQVSAASPPTFFQIPLADGRMACSFFSTQLVCLVTEPPVLLDSTEPTRTFHAGPVIPSPYVQMDDFLTSAEQQQILSYALQHEADFIPSRVTTNEPGYRSSSVIDRRDQAEEFSPFFVNRLKAYFPYILRAFNIAPFPAGEIETQLTAHNDGHYFKIHPDNGDEQTSGREISYVYYFYREPKAFSGGELRLYDGRVNNGAYVPAESFNLIEPRNNRLIAFPSRCQHEVLPIRCATGAFADSRFTVNGWIHKQSEDAAQQPSMAKTERTLAPEVA